jgi:hypothetical protein
MLRCGGGNGWPLSGGEKAMQYMLLIYGNEAATHGMSEPQASERMGAYMAYTKALRESGALVAGNRLSAASSATTVRMANGKRQVLNGPYAETREQLGGYYLIEAPDLDAAIAWAARCPGAQTGIVEVRPLMATPMPT